MQVTEQTLELENACVEIDRFGDILCILSDILESDECSAYAEQYSAVAMAALVFLQTTRERLKNVIEQLSAQSKESVA